jgi:nucleoside 2-deoxyribosyltransferase
MRQAYTPEPLDLWRKVQDQFGQAPMVLYLAGPLRGDGSPEAIRHNQDQMAVMARRVQALLPQATLVVPHGNFSFVDEAGEAGLGVRAQVLLACERLLARCDGLILCGATLSPGMARERAVALREGIPLVQVPGWEPWVNNEKIIAI